MDVKKKSCVACGELEECNLELAWAQLQQAVEDGCELCTVVKAGVLSFVPDAAEIADQLILSVDVSLIVSIVGKDKNQPMVVEFYTILGAPSVWPGVGPARHVSADSSADECVSLARKWLHGCLSLHSECQRPDVPKLPTRVVAVGSCDEETRIIVTEPGERGEYAALSHCWGGVHPVVLLSSNLEALQERLHLNPASKTFREAISFTRRLGIPYLWIDSLCILQDEDDPSDWQREAPRMSTVYNSATVTLSAASSSDMAGGLFPNRAGRAPRQRVVEIAAPAPNGSTTTVYARGRKIDPRDAGEFVHSLFEPEPPHLRSRAWVLQEDQLSPRILHFRKEELAWTCSSCSRCECRIRPSLPQPHPFRRSPGTIRDEDKPQMTGRFSLRWPAMVMDYTRRNLTKERDRIAALSGLARYIERCTTDTFFCGLFYEDISFQLLWHIDRDGRVPGQSPRGRFSAPYAPSWSWMSVSGPINYFHRHPLGAAPSHPATRGRDAVSTIGTVVGVGRIPADQSNVMGPVLLAPMFLVTGVVPITRDTESGQWQPAYPIRDFASENLKFHIDIEEDETKFHNGNGDSYALILAGRWEGEGMTILCMETVCILGRLLSTPEEVNLVTLARQYQQQTSEDQILGNPETFKSDWSLPDPSCSYFRIGLARGAGSLKAWEQAGVPSVGRAFLF